MRYALDARRGSIRRQEANVNYKATITSAPPSTTTSAISLQENIQNLSNQAEIVVVDSGYKCLTPPQFCKSPFAEHTIMKEETSLSEAQSVSAIKKI